MAKILLIGASRKDQENLASALRVHGHASQFIDSRRLSCVDWKNSASAVDVVVFDVTLFNAEVSRQLHQICQQSRESGMPLPVLCHSKVYRGPRFELDLERLGARFVYER